ncbi:MAG: hypothetical protein A2Z72_06245 [Omnitrophica bacterium RBG_13_46_9]|nr:MAG: hypothetical protein A2Z72_06245 [Omnitrophica bacterium RBG_13_46_9]
MPGKASVLWTGGKDSSLAHYKARRMGYEVVNLVTFIPTGAEFHAHPLAFIKYQAGALDLSHVMLEINEPFKENYERAIDLLKKEYKIDTLVTGDISEIDGYPNWIRECSKYSGMKVLNPLWHYDRYKLIRELISYGFKAIFSCVKKPWLTGEWVGKELNEESLARLVNLNSETGLDICGEHGEYHTLVLDGPLFNRRIGIGAYLRREKDPLIYLDILKAGLQER